MLPIVLLAGHRESASLVRAFLACTALVLLVSLAFSPGFEQGLGDAGLEGRSATAATGAASLLAVLARLVRGRGHQERPLAERRLALPPPDLELHVATARERPATDSATGAPAVDEPRPVWVRRLEAWAGPPRGNEVGVHFEDDWEAVSADPPTGPGGEARPPAPPAD